MSEFYRSVIGAVVGGVNSRERFLMNGSSLLSNTLLPDLSVARDVADIRRILGPLHRSGDVRWLRLDGLSVDPLEVHGAFLHGLARWGLGNEMELAGERMPAIAVLDWSLAGHYSAEGVALLPLVAHALHVRGAHVICCGPADADLAALVETARLPEVCQGTCESEADGANRFTWLVPADRGAPVSRSVTRQPKARLLVPLITVEPAVRDGRLGQFVRDLKASACAIGFEDDLAELIAAVTTELFENLREYSGADRAAAVALLWPRRRPGLLEIGIADGGIGIGASVASQERHAWLGAFPESTQTATVLSGALSSRATAAGGGGGLSRTLEELFACCEATVVIRSRSGSVDVSRLGRGMRAVRGTTYGWGTQTRLAIKVPVRAA